VGEKEEKGPSSRKQWDLLQLPGVPSIPKCMEYSFHNLLREKWFDQNIIKLFNHVLLPSLFCFNRQFYKQSPVSANIFLENSEEKSLNKTRIHTQEWRPLNKTIWYYRSCRPPCTQYITLISCHMITVVLFNSYCQSFHACCKTYVLHSIQDLLLLLLFILCLLLFLTFISCVFLSSIHVCNHFFGFRNTRR